MSQPDVESLHYVRMTLCNWLLGEIPETHLGHFYVQNLDSNGQPVEIDKAATVQIMFWTRTNTYSLMARPGHLGLASYLGCTYSRRAPYPGEQHTRGGDLADGKFELATWNKILRDIVANELVKIGDPDL